MRPLGGLTDEICALRHFAKDMESVTRSQRFISNWRAGEGKERELQLKMSISSDLKITLG